MISLRVNGTDQQLEVDPDTPLLWALRDGLGLTGTKYGCGIARCGACTVHVDGQPALACITPVSAVAGRSITTIEGLSDDLGHALRGAWTAEQVPQCGYCQSGQLMTAAALLARNPNPTEEQIERALSGVLCRCGTYQRVRRAVRRVLNPAQEA